MYESHSIRKCVTRKRNLYWQLNKLMFLLQFVSQCYIPLKPLKDGIHETNILSNDSNDYSNALVPHMLFICDDRYSLYAAMASKTDLHPPSPSQVWLSPPCLSFSDSILPLNLLQDFDPASPSLLIQLC